MDQIECLVPLPVTMVDNPHEYSPPTLAELRTGLQGLKVARKKLAEAIDGKLRIGTLSRKASRVFERLQKSGKYSEPELSVLHNKIAPQRKIREIHEGYRAAQQLLEDAWIEIQGPLDILRRSFGPGDLAILGALNGPSFGLAEADRAIALIESCLEEEQSPLNTARIATREPVTRASDSTPDKVPADLPVKETVEERKARVAAFRKTYQCKADLIYKTARVHKKNYYDWLNLKMKDSSAMAQRLEGTMKSIATSKGRSVPSCQ